MATTTNYGWTTPDDTALVKDGASAIRSLGTSVDTTTKALNPGTTAGDLDYYTASTTKSRIGIGTNGQVLTSNGSVPSWQTPASGVITWTNRITGDGNQFTNIAYNGTNLYVAAGYNGKLYSSANGTTWTSRTSGFGTNRIQDVSFGNGLWVAVGENGTLTTSTDGTTWTARTSNMGTDTIYAVLYANSLWVAVGSGGGSTNTGGIIYSSDGTTWTRKSQTPTVGTNYYTVSWNGTNWLVGTNISTNNYIYATTPSGTWTAAVTSAAGAIGQIYYDGTRNIWSDGTSVYFSTGTTLASATIYSSVSVVAGNETVKGYLKFYNSALYRFGVGLQSYTGLSGTYVSPSAITFLPTATLASAGTSFSGGSNSVGNFVGAIGYIATDSVGRLYTSF